MNKRCNSTVQGLPCNVNIYPAGREIPTFYATRRFITVLTKVRRPESLLTSPNFPLRYILILFHLFLGIPTSQDKIMYKFTISHMSKIPLYHTSLLTPLNPSGYFLYHQAPHNKTKLLSAHRMYVICPAYDFYNKQRIFPYT